MISQEQIVELQSVGFVVEDMGVEWGEEWQGQFRWLNENVPGDGFGFPQSSLEEAWVDAKQYRKEYCAF